MLRVHVTYVTGTTRTVVQSGVVEDSNTTAVRILSEILTFILERSSRAKARLSHGWYQTRSVDRMYGILIAFAPVRVHSAFTERIFV